MWLQQTTDSLLLTKLGKSGVLLDPRTWTESAAFFFILGGGPVCLLQLEILLSKQEGSWLNNQIHPAVSAVSFVQYLIIVPCVDFLTATWERLSLCSAVWVREASVHTCKKFSIS